MPGIIVGVDGSDHSRLALAWAMREAVHHHVPLTVMTVNPAPVRPATEIYWGIHPPRRTARIWSSRRRRSGNSWTASRTKSARPGRISR
jgi:nucleotide-binding universal stress UspA family protein